jgi:tRNA (cytidine/uridine-2'-O-)-methyltransferase
MFHVALFEPEIPPNTGNIIRLCANTGAQLHLIHPLGFNLETRQLRRAGLDYHEWVSVKEYPDYLTFHNQFKSFRIFACTTKGSQCYSKVEYQENDVFLFGPESRGLPGNILQEFNEKEKIRIPMRNYARSLNLSNAVAIIVYEAWRQNGFMEA